MSYTPFYPMGLPYEPTPPLPLSQNQELIPVIIQFNIPALLQKFPGLKGKQLQDHPYLQELKTKYNDWINQVKENINAPSIEIRHKLDLLVSGIAVTLTKEQVEKLDDLQLPFIKAMYPDEKTTTDTQRIPHHRPRIQQGTDLNQHNLDIIGIPQVRTMTDTHDQPLDGRGIRVAVLDHGFDLELLRFGPAGSVIDRYNLDGKNTHVFTPGESVHGAMVIQIILDVAPNTAILAYKTISASDIAAGLSRAVENEAKIVNIPLYIIRDFDLINDAITTALENGVIVVNSSGNNSKRDEVSAPGSSLEVFSVGATNKAGNKVASFSNYDSALLKPDVVAPGYYSFESETDSGTSIAAPYVSGAMVLILQLHPDWTPAQVMSALATTATPVTERDSYAVFSGGSGRIDVPTALQTDTLISPIHIAITTIPGLQKKVALHITNKSNVEKTYSIQWKKKKETSSISFPPSITIPPGESQKLSFTIKTPQGPKKFSGLLQLISGNMQWHIPIQVDTIFYFNTGNAITSIAFSPIEPLIALGSDKSVQLWNISTRTPERIHSFNAGDIVNSVAFSPDGKYIASGSFNKYIQLWDASTGNQEPVHSFDARGNVYSVAFDPLGRYIASGADGEVQLWDISIRNTLPAYSFDIEQLVFSVSFSPDGQYLASGTGDDNVLLWNVSSYKPVFIQSFTAGDFVNSVAFSPIGSLIASGADNHKVQLWDISAGNRQPTFSFNAGADVNSVAFSFDGKFIASGSHNEKVQVWDISTESTLPAYSFKVGADVKSVAFSPTEPLIASGSDNGKVQFWSLD